MPKQILGLLSNRLNLSGCQLIQHQLDGNQAPLVNHLMPDPSEGNSSAG
jgi:hypothetical protein